MTVQKPNIGVDPAPAKKVVNESGIEIKTLYTREDVIASGGIDESLPGEAPFTRGIHKEMYRKRPWTMRQYTGFSNAADTNERFHYLIANGQTGLNVAFDLVSQCGYDSDSPEAFGEVGRVGMAIDTLKDFEIAFDGIDLDKITVSLTINGSAAIMIAMYLAMAEKRGFDVKNLRGTAQNDILKEFIGRGTWIFPVEASVKLVPTRSNIAPRTRRNIRRSAFAAITSANPAPTRPRRWVSPSPSPRPIPTRRSSAG